VKSPDGTVKDYPLRRDTIKVASIKGWKHLPGGGWEYLVDPENRIGYLRLTNFTKDTSRELDAAIDALNTRGAARDHPRPRTTPGGLLTAATDVSDKFMKDGIIVTTRPDREEGNPPDRRQRASRRDRERPAAGRAGQPITRPAPARFVSGALKDQKRALIVGERTFGKGSVQMLFPLNQARGVPQADDEPLLPAERAGASTARRTARTGALTRT
jgi:carboxyl-terminal processing protease